MPLRECRQSMRNSVRLRRNRLRNGTGSALRIFMPPHSNGTTSFVAGSIHAPRRIVIFHGYTGSPDEFKDLAGHLASALEAYVTVPLLPGHGTVQTDLLSV